MQYAAVKFLCRVNGRVYNTTSDMSSAPNPTKLSLFNYTDPDKITYRNGTVPEQCIYRHHAEFVAAISEVLHEDVFNGYCYNGKIGASCARAGVTPSRLENMAVNSVLQTLNEGNRSFANTTNLFDSFANAMTNRFRFEYGSATFNETDRNLPLGEIQGVAWQDSTCVQMQVKWLLLPICLTVFTTVLMMWTVGANWIGRKSRPVWKGSLFPLIIYEDSIESKEGARGTGRGEAEREGKLMEVHEMSERSKKMPVTFVFPDKDGGDGDAQKQGKSWFRWRGRGKKDADALLGSAQK